MQRCFCETLCCLPWDFCSPDRLSTLWCQAKVGLRVLYIVVSSGAKPISDPIYMAVNPTPPPQPRDRYVWNNLGTLVASWRMGQFIFGLGTASRFFVTKSRLEEKRSRRKLIAFCSLTQWELDPSKGSVVKSIKMGLCHFPADGTLWEWKGGLTKYVGIHKPCLCVIWG